MGLNLMNKILNNNKYLVGHKTKLNSPGLIGGIPLGFTGIWWDSPGIGGIPLGFTGNWWDFAGIHRELLGFTGNWWDPAGNWWDSPGIPVAIILGIPLGLSRDFLGSHQNSRHFSPVGFRRDPGHNPGGIPPGSRVHFYWGNNYSFEINVFVCDQY